MADHRRATCLAMAGLLFFLAIGAPPTALGQPTVVLIDRSHGTPDVGDSEIADFAREARTWGLQVYSSTSSLSAALNQTVGLLIMAGATANLTSAELSALNLWLSNGGTLWLAASSNDSRSPGVASEVLRSIGSSLRFENLYVTDSQLYASSTDMVIAPIINHALLPGETVTLNVRTAAAYRPVPIIGMKDGIPASLETLDSAGAMWLVRTASTSISRELAGSPPPLLYSAGSERSYPIVAIEDLQSEGRVALTGSPLFSNPTIMAGMYAMFTYSSSEPHDNTVLVRNLVGWGLHRQITERVEPYVSAAKLTQPLTALIDLGHGNPYLGETAVFTKWTNFLTDLGFEPRLLRGTLTTSELDTADLLIVVSPANEYSTEEIAALGAWMLEVGKCLWLATTGDSQTGEGARSAAILNSLLNIIQSRQRFDHGTVFDSELNVAEGSYRPLLAYMNRNDSITANIRTLYLSAPSPIASFDMTSRKASRFNFSLPPANVTWIAKTTADSTLNDLDYLNDTLVYHSGDKGPFPLVTSETIVGSQVVLFGAPIFLDVDKMFSYPAPGGYPVDNILLIRSLLANITQEKATTTTVAATAEPDSIVEGESVSFQINYTYKGYQLENITRQENVPVLDANVTIKSAGSTYAAADLGNGTYSTTQTISAIGRQTYTVSVLKIGYLSQTSSVIVEVAASPARYAPYMFGMILFVSIVTIGYVIVRRVR